jgi:hypothetical protein
MSRHRFLIRWSCSIAAIGTGLLWLERVGSRDLGGPPASVDGVLSWIEHRDPAVAAFALLRLGAMVVGWYLLIITAAGGLTSAFHLERGTTTVNRLTVPFARGMLGGATLLGVAGTPPSLPLDHSDTMIELPPTTASTTTDPNDTATLHLLPDAATSTTVPEPEAPPEPSASDASVTSSSTTTTWVVQQGESFWSIAAEHLTDLSGRPVSDDEVTPYWRELIEHNRSRLANPDDANLLFTGQELDLPAAVSG